MQIGRRHDLAPGGSARSYELGVLFVHGIGEQQRGEALAAWSDAVYAFLHRWLSCDNDVERARGAREQLQARARWPKNDKECAALAALEAEAASRSSAEHALDQGLVPVQVSQSHLRSVPGEEDPAHLVLEIRSPQPVGDLLTEDNAGPPSAWLLAESWWAQEFSAPPSRVILRWALRVAPVVVLGHLATSMARLERFRPFGPRRVVGVLLGLVAFACALVALVAALLVLLVLLLLETLPLPKLTAAARQLGTRLAGSVGDSYLLVTGASEYDAMVTRVENDLVWLASRCERVAVVAHSQGAVIAHRALRRCVSGTPDLFVTLGSGLGKLTEIETLRARPNSLRLTSMILAYPLAGLAISLAASRVLEPGRFTTVVLVANAVVYLLCSAFGYLQLVRDRPQEEVRRGRRLRSLPLAGRTRWVDYFSSADLVPNGPLFDEDPEWLRSYETWYESWWLNDHFGYRKNEDGLIAPLVLELVRTAGGGLDRSPETSGARVQMLGRRRAWRCAWLARARPLLLTAGVIALPYHWQTLSKYGETLRGRTPAPAKQILAAMGDALLLPSGLELPADAVLAGVFACLLLAIALSLTTVAWRRVGARDLARFYRGDDPDYGGPPALVFAAVVGGLVALAVGPVLAARLPGPSALALQCFGIYCIGTISSAFLAYLDMADDPEAPVSDPRQRQRRAESRQAHGLQVGLLGAVPALPTTAVALWMLLGLDTSTLSPWLQWPAWMLGMFVLVLAPWLAGKVLWTRVRHVLDRWGCRWCARSLRQRGLRDVAAG